MLALLHASQQSWRDPELGFGKRGLLEMGSFQKSPFSRDSRELEILEIPPAKRPLS